MKWPLILPAGLLALSLACDSGGNFERDPTDRDVTVAEMTWGDTLAVLGGVETTNPLEQWSGFQGLAMLDEESIVYGGGGHPGLTLVRTDGSGWRTSVGSGPGEFSEAPRFSAFGDRVVAGCRGEPTYTFAADDGTVIDRRDPVGPAPAAAGTLWICAGVLEAAVVYSLHAPRFELEPTASGRLLVVPATGEAIELRLPDGQRWDDENSLVYAARGRWIAYGVRGAASFTIFDIESRNPIVVSLPSGTIGGLKIDASGRMWANRHAFDAGGRPILIFPEGFTPYDAAGDVGLRLRTGPSGAREVLFVRMVPRTP